MPHHAVTFGLARTEEEKRKVYQMRATHYAVEAPYLLNADQTNPGQDCFDACSMVFYLCHEGEIVATSRLTPYHQNRWEISDAIPNELLDFDPQVYAQFNRILVDRRYRNRSFHELMFYMACEWTLTNTAIRSYFSVCTVPHYRFYANYGATRAHDHPLYLPCRSQTPYLLVQGTLEDARRLTRQQLEKTRRLPDPRPAFP